MEQLVIRNLDDTILKQVKRRAWECGLPLEEFVRRVIVASATIGDDGVSGLDVTLILQRERKPAAPAERALVLS